MGRSELTFEQKKELHRENWPKAVEWAKQNVKHGDRVGATKCPGTKRVFTFDFFDGNWMVSKSGIDDYSPCSIYSVNGVDVSDQIEGLLYGEE